jgi:hypothetical protein
VILHIFLVPEQHSILAMDRDEILRPGGLDHDLDVFLRRVSGDMERVDASLQ